MITGLPVFGGGPELSVRVMDLASEFLLAVLGATDRRKGWTEYEHAHPDVFEVYFQNPYWGQRSDLDEALGRLAAVEPQIRRLAAVAPTEAARVGDSVSTLLDAKGVDVLCIVFVGLFGANGFQASIGGVPTLFLALERIPDTIALGLLIAHEVTHAFHSDLRSGAWDDNDALQATFTEGLAVHVSELARSGLPPEEYLWMRSPLTIASSQYESAFREGVQELLSGHKLGDYQRLFNYDPSRPPAGLPPRFGYYAGMRVLDQISSQYSVQSMARWSSGEAVVATRNALLALLASPAEP
jgi:hypothetical protein